MILLKSQSISVQLMLNGRLLALFYFASAARNEFDSQVRDRESDAGVRRLRHCRSAQQKLRRLR